jgi:hypothetical protein
MNEERGAALRLLY